MRCRSGVVSTSENPFDWNMICTAPDGSDRLWWKVSKTTLTAVCPKAPACLCAAPESLMPLHGLLAALQRKVK